MDEEYQDLEKEQIEQAKILITELDKMQLKIRAAFWLYDKKTTPLWKLFLASASPELDVKENLLHARKTLLDTVHRLPQLENFPITSLELIPLDHPFITCIATTFTTGPGISNISMKKNQFDHLYIEALHLFRLQP